MSIVSFIKSLRGDATARSSQLPHIVEEISALIAGAADVNAAVGPQQSRAIHVAAQLGLAPVVQMLIAARADVRVANADGETALHVVAKWPVDGDLRVATMLVDAGADINALDDHDYTPCHYAAQNDSLDLLRLLLAAGASIDGRVTPLHCAAIRGKVNAARLLISTGADVHARDSRLFTPLHLAASAECVFALLEAGADVHAAGAQGQTACAVAAMSNAESAVKALVAAGADVHAADADGNTPCHHAALAGGTGTLKWLLGGGANVNAVNREGETPLHRATDSNSSVLATLVAGGANFALTDRRGLTALQVAKRHRNPQVVPFLTAVCECDDVSQRAWFPKLQAEFAAARHELERMQFERLRGRALQICIALRAARLPAALLVAVIDAACATSLIPDVCVIGRFVATVMQ
jgi:ankyrin repeat protein